MLILSLPTERPGVTVRELATAGDDIAYFEAIHEDREHVDQYGNTFSWQYPTVEAVRNARLAPNLKLRMGVWDEDSFKGTVNAEPNVSGASAEVGYWLRASATGHGYATLALRALTDFLEPTYERLFAEIHRENVPSMLVAERAGYHAAGTAIRAWGQAVIFERPHID